MNGSPWCLLLVVSFPLTAEAEIVHVRGTTMGPIVWNAKVSTLPAGWNADRLQARLDERLERVNGLMSTWESESEISRFNRSRSTEWFAVSPETADVAARARAVSEASNGAFDVTVAPLVNLWSFGENAVPERLPDAAAITAAREHVGWRKLSVRSDPPGLRKSDPELTVNLSAIAKGFAVDEVARELESLGVEGFLVEVGGELRVRGRKPDGSPWKVGIERPWDGPQRVHRALSIGDRALATSGDYRNYFERDGIRYSHTIDPSTGRPVRHRLASVSVVAETCTDADAWATALMVLGPDRGYDLATSRDLPVLFLVRDGERFVDRATPSFERIAPHVAHPETASPDNASPAAEEAGTSAMTTALIAFGVFLAAIAAMAVGVILGNRRITGSCGGLANMKDRTGRSICEACTNPLPTCGGVEEGRERDQTLQATGAASGDEGRGPTA